VGEHFEEHFTILRPVRSGSQDVTLVAFDHTEDGFDLPALAVGAAVESLLHESAILALKRLGGRSAVSGRNRAAGGNGGISTPDAARHALARQSRGWRTQSPLPLPSQGLMAKLGVRHGWQALWFRDRRTARPSRATADRRRPSTQTTRPSRQARPQAETNGEMSILSPDFQPGFHLHTRCSAGTSPAWPMKRNCSLTSTACKKTA